jgi:multidrug efflux pump subunit AcrB
MWIVRLALRRPYTFIVAALVVLLTGVLSLRSMSTDIFPTIDIPVVTVVWRYGGLTPDDMAKRITTYSEYTISSVVDNVRTIESQTLSGVSVIKVYFQEGANVDGAIAQLAAVSQTILRIMPPGTLPPLIIRYNASSVPILQLSLSSQKLPESALYDYGL